MGRRIRAHGLSAEFKQPARYVRVTHRRGRFLLQPFDDLARRFARHEQAVPALQLEAGKAQFAHRGNIGQAGDALGGGGGQRFEGAGLDLGQGG